MNAFTHVRQKPAVELDRPRELIVACVPMRSNVNLSRIVRAAGSCGVTKVLCCGTAKVIGKIARDGADTVEIEVHRTLAHPLKRLREEGYRLVGLEQTTGSQCLYDYRFARRSVLVVGNERAGLDEEILALVDDVAEIPVYGLPHAYNAATSATMALYEYCRQYPRG